MAKDAGYMGDNGTRRLRELTEEGKIDVQYDPTRYRYVPDLEELAELTDKL